MNKELFEELLHAAGLWDVDEKTDIALLALLEEITQRCAAIAEAAPTATAAAEWIRKYTGLVDADDLGPLTFVRVDGSDGSCTRLQLVADE